MQTNKSQQNKYKKKSKIRTRNEKGNQSVKLI